MNVYDALFIIGFALIGLSLGYACWVKVRVIRLREDLFEIRDDLFDAARRLNGFNDPAYREARIHIHALITMADSISIPCVLFLSQSASEKESASSSNPAMQEAIDKAKRLYIQRTQRYLFGETLGGLLVTAVVWALPKLTRQKGQEAEVARALNSVVTSEIAIATKRCLLA